MGSRPRRPGDAALRDAFAAAKLTGKKGETLLVRLVSGPGPRSGFAAGAVLLVGVGPKDEFDVTAFGARSGARRGTARRFGTVATTFALALGARHATDAVQAAAEGLGLGAYRFRRYKTTSKDDDGDLGSVTVLGSATWDAQARCAPPRSVPTSSWTRSRGRATW